MQTCNGGNCSPREIPSATADPFLPELEERLTQPHPGRLRRHPPRAVGGRRRTPTRRPPRRSPLVAHPRPATANAEPGTRNPQRRPSDQAHDHEPHATSSHPCRARRRLPRSARAAETSTRITYARDVFRWSVAEPPDQYSSGAARAGPPLRVSPCSAGRSTSGTHGDALRGPQVLSVEATPCSQGGSTCISVPRQRQVSDFSRR